MNGPIVIATLATNTRETVRIALDHYKGEYLVDVRLCSTLTATSGVMIPTAKGVSLNVAMLSALIAGLTAAEAKARKIGLLGEGLQ